MIRPNCLCTFCGRSSLDALQDLIERVRLSVMRELDVAHQVAHRFDARSASASQRRRLARSRSMVLLLLGGAGATAGSVEVPPGAAGVNVGRAGFSGHGMRLVGRPHGHGLRHQYVTLRRGLQCLEQLTLRLAAEGKRARASVGALWRCQRLFVDFRLRKYYIVVQHAILSIRVFVDTHAARAVGVRTRCK